MHNNFRRLLFIAFAFALPLLVLAGKTKPVNFTVSRQHPATDYFKSVSNSRLVKPETPNILTIEYAMNTLKTGEALPMLSGMIEANK